MWKATTIVLLELAAQLELPVKELAIALAATRCL